MIIGVDPGSTTGILLYYAPERVIHMQLDVKETARYLSSEIGMRAEFDELEAVVCERYEITQETIRKRQTPDPYHVEGFVRLTCALYSVPFIQYKRADAKHFATDRKLRVLGWLAMGMDHANDAARQVLQHVGDRTEIAKLLAEGLRASR